MIPIPASVSCLVLRLALAAALIAGLPRQAAAWGDEGHQVIALVADHFLAPAARQRVAALLATDDSLLTQHDMPSEATWADKFAQSDRDTTRQRSDGVLHQPLHAADDHDAGGGKVEVAAPGIEAKNLHIYWDVDAVRQLGGGAGEIASRLIAGITPEEQQSWCRGSAADWALETF